MRLLSFAFAALALSIFSPAQRQVLVHPGQREKAPAWDDPAVGVSVRSLKLVGDAVLTASEVGELQRAVRSHRHHQGDLARELQERVRDLCQRHGYFKAVVEDPKFTVVQETARGQSVDASLTVHAGRIYRLEGLIFTGVTAFSADEVGRAIVLSPGDVFNTGKVRSSLEQLRRLYCTKGYVNFTLVPGTKLNEDAGLVTLAIDADEGPVYRVGELTVLGEESVPGAKDKLLAAWSKYQGKPYNCGSLLRDFLRDVNASPGIRPEDVFSTSADGRAQVVNVQMMLARPHR